LTRKAVIVEKGKDKVQQREVVIALLLLAIVMCAAVYVFVVPRVKLEIRTWYTEGMFESINIDFLLKNKGTVTIEDLTISITIYNASGCVLDGFNQGDITIKPWRKVALPNIQIFGSENNTHYTQYRIVIEILCTARGDRYSAHIEHVTEEPYLTLTWEDRAI